jgi:hypothetical protein
MNRSILIVICDFLLVSLVAFSNFDSLSPEHTPTPKMEISTERRPAPGSNDMVSTLKMALEDEKQARDKLSAELSNSRESIQARETQLAERDSRLREYQTNLQRTEAEARQLQEQRAALEKQMAAAQNNLKSLQGDLSASLTTAKLSNEQLSAMQKDLQRRQLEAETLRQRLSDLEKSHSNVLSAKQVLDTKVQVAEAEKRLTQEQLTAMKSEVQTVRAEKAQIQASATKLAEGVTALAQTSTDLTKEIRENRPLAANTIFNEFSTNRVATEFFSTRSGIFGREVKKKRDTQTLLVTDGAETYALYHIADTPLTLWPPGTDWEALSGYVSRGPTSFSISQIAFLAQDPRVVIVPVGTNAARLLGSKVYKIAPDPFKFADAVLVGANEGYYGECKFQIDPSTPEYVRMDRSLFRGLFGKFNPSRGDLVLSKTGELLGIMVNNEYCSVLRKIVPGFAFECGDNLRAQNASQVLDQLGTRVRTMPAKLQ